MSSSARGHFLCLFQILTTFTMWLKTEIRKGEGMQLDQLIEDTSYSRETNARIQPFDLDVLAEAFHLRETAPVDLPAAEKGIPTIAGKSKSESKDKERKHKKHKDKDREKDKEYKKHKHRNKDRSKDKDKEKKKDKSGHHDSVAEHTKKHHEKVRLLDFHPFAFFVSEVLSCPRSDVIL
ncbi:hypothetical protein U1Q18_041922 [Sarracenia purpurea var. burkii]